MRTKKNGAFPKSIQPHKSSPRVNKTFPQERLNANRRRQFRMTALEAVNSNPRAQVHRRIRLNKSSEIPSCVATGTDPHNMLARGAMGKIPREKAAVDLLRTDEQGRTRRPDSGSRLPDDDETSGRWR